MCAAPTAHMQFYFEGERHTLASALRASLERLCPDDFVACTLVHPLDTHLVVDAPSEESVRRALLEIKAQIARARRTSPVPWQTPRGSSAARA